MTWWRARSGTSAEYLSVITLTSLTAGDDANLELADRLEELDREWSMALRTRPLIVVGFTTLWLAAIGVMVWRRIWLFVSARDVAVYCSAALVFLLFASWWTMRPMRLRLVGFAALQTFYLIVDLEANCVGGDLGNGDKKGTWRYAGYRASVMADLERIAKTIELIPVAFRRTSEGALTAALTAARSRAAYLRSLQTNVAVPKATVSKSAASESASSASTSTSTSGDHGDSAPAEYSASDLVGTLKEMLLFLKDGRWWELKAIDVSSARVLRWRWVFLAFGLLVLAGVAALVGYSVALVLHVPPAALAQVMSIPLVLGAGATAFRAGVPADALRLMVSAAGMLRGRATED